MLLLALAPTRARAEELCRIEIVEAGSGWPVPLVELRTVHGVRFVSDNAGVIAFDLPEAMHRETWLFVSGHGYEVDADGFGYRGVRLIPEPGETRTVQVKRTSIARRLGRSTGAGLFAESQRFGDAQDWPESGIWGCDSVQVVVHRGRLFWGWGDTTISSYPLGVFHMTGATTVRRPLSSFEPPLRLRFDLLDDGTGKPVAIAPMPGDGPTWVAGCVSLPAANGETRMVGSYIKVRKPMNAYESGLCVWNDETRRFERWRKLWSESEGRDAPRMPEGHAVAWRDAKSEEWILFGNPFPALRVPATFEAWQDASRWEPLTPQATVISSHDGAPVKPHSGSIAWNARRGRWVAVFTESFGRPSAFGEVWYAEAPTPTGPWGAAVKILSHDHYTFYNPRLLPELVEDDAPFLLFEGTYSQQFADSPQPTPRYDYNQVLYRLDLDDPALISAREGEPRAARERK
ncbi:MAG: hypothetical protein KDC38_17285 [Planctomycetes bacterium]|nr:hypothetical protein [Planctomycetota bacterium]